MNHATDNGTTTQSVSSVFGLLILAQAAHSVEEYVGRLWESFPPAAFVSGLISNDRQLGFLIANVAIVSFGAWCYFGPVRHNRRSAGSIISVWIVVEMINGIGHPLWAILQRAYTPGVLTAPLLLALAIWLATKNRPPVLRNT